MLGGMAHDERADLYSLGVLTWLLFTGGMPGSAQPPVQPRPEVGEWKEIGELLTKTCAKKNPSNAERDHLEFICELSFCHMNFYTLSE